MSMDFSGRTALVTGAAQGLGFTIAEMLCNAGARVALVDLNPLVRKAAEELTRAGAVVIGEVADVTSQESVKALHARVNQQFGKIEILINNAGKYKPQAISDISSDDFDHLIAINLKSTFLVTQAFLLVRICTSSSGQKDGRRTRRMDMVGQ